MKRKSKKKGNYTPSHGIRIDEEDFVTISKWLKKAHRSWKFLMKCIARQIREKQSLNIDLLLLEARKPKESRTVNLWESDKEYKKVRESFPVLNKEREVDEWI